MRTAPGFLLIALASAGCAATGMYAYTPRGATQWNDGYRSVVVKAPHGAVEIASFGITELTADEVGAMQTVHVRLAIANTGDDRAWTFDASAVTTDLGGAGPTRPTFVNGDVPTLPIALVDRGQRRVIDLYFAVPPRISDEDDLAAFDVTWRITTPDGRLEAITHFDRQDLVPPPTVSVAHPAGWGARWWFDRAYSWPIFFHESGILTARPPVHVIVSRPPRWHARTTAQRL